MLIFSLKWFSITLLLYVLIIIIIAIVRVHKREKNKKRFEEKAILLPKEQVTMKENVIAVLKKENGNEKGNKRFIR